MALVALIVVGGTRGEIAAGPPVPCNCCSGGDGVGCDCQACQDIVCAVDLFCCEQTWDEVCDAEAADFCSCCTEGCNTELAFYNDEQEFKDNCDAVLTTEDFSCSAAGPGGVCSGVTPLDSTTNDGCFNACLTEGFEFNAIGIGNYAAVGTGYLGVGLPAVGPNYFSDESNFTFSPAAGCVGFRVIGDALGSVDVTCTFQPSGSHAAVHGSLGGVFIGAIDPAGITAVDCVEQADQMADLYGNLQFADVGGPPPPPVAASGIWGMIALIGLLMVGSLFFMRRRAEA